MEKKFYIPSINLMHINLTSYTKALCLCINRGYLEFDNLKDLLDIIDYIRDKTKIEIVGNTDKIRVDNDKYVYRQRLYFIAIVDIFKLCEKFKVEFCFTDDIYFLTKTLKNNVTEQKYLDYYANKLGYSKYSEWLLNVCKIYIMFYLRLKNIEHLSNIDEDVEQFIHSKKGYLDRAPYFMSICDMKNKNFVVFQQTDLEDPCLYTTNNTNSILAYGFTNRNILDDKKKGLLKV